MQLQMTHGLIFVTSPVQTLSTLSHLMLFLKLYHCDFFEQPAVLIKSASF